ncbi:hypothetical protein EDC01DRAFT_626257 [Geopyxis carbonaria]|nr:hypothetical protein EDC01DRAFT_626257 [Geopyxis carbonaria]
MAMREFAQQLLTIQKETSKEVTNPDGSTEFVSTVLPDCMVHIRIFLNASPEHASLTECLSTVKNKLPLSIVLDLYEAAEEAHAARTIAQKGQVRRGYRSKPY